MRLLKQDRAYLFLIVILFIAAVILGEYLPVIQPDFAKIFEQAVTARLKSIAEDFKTLPVWMWVVEIWLNNMVASVTAVIMGMLLSPVFPLLTLMSNGIIMGLFQRKMEVLGLSAGRYYLGLVPHGIFELPAFFMAIMMGIQLGIITYRLIGQYLRGEGAGSFLQKIFGEFSHYFQKKGRYYAVLVTTMLLIAAIIEIAVSPMLLRN